MKQNILILVFIAATAACTTDVDRTGSLKLYHELDGQRFDMTDLESSLNCSPAIELPPADEDDIQISAPIGGEENPSETVEEPSQPPADGSESEPTPSLGESAPADPMEGNMDDSEPEITVSGTAPSALARIATRQSSASNLTISFSYPNFVIRSDGDEVLSGTWEPLDENTVLITVDGVEEEVDIKIGEDGVIVPILPEGISLNPACNPDPEPIPADELPADQPPADEPPSDEPPSDGGDSTNSVTETVDGFTFGTVKESFFFVIDDEGGGIYVGMTDEEVCCHCDTPGQATNLVTFGGITPEIGSYTSDTMVVRVGRVDANGEPVGEILDSESMSVTLLTLSEERVTGTFSAQFTGGQTVEGSFDAEFCPIESE